MENLTVNKKICVMFGEPSPELTAEIAEKAIAEIKTEKELAALFAKVENKAWWIEDGEYDFEEGTEEHKLAKAKSDLWFDLADRLKNKIFDILRSEGVEIPKTKQIVVLEPFMKRNGFKDGQGWWIYVDSISKNRKRKI